MSYVFEIEIKSSNIQIISKEKERKLLYAEHKNARVTNVRFANEIKTIEKQLSLYL